MQTPPLCLRSDQGERVVADVLFEEAGERTLEHRTPDRTYQLATIAVREEQAEPSLAVKLANLRTNGDMSAGQPRSRLEVHDGWLLATPRAMPLR